MRPRAKWAVDSEAMRERGITFIAFSKIQLVGKKNIKTRLLSLVKAGQKAIQPPLFWFGFQSSAFCYSWAMTYSLVVVQPIRMLH